MTSEHRVGLYFSSEVENMKTNEFLRRRKLRIQQVREQSKHIANKIRQRANAEKDKHLVSLDAEKEKAYFEQQDKLVKKLEQLYVKGLNKVGTSHKDATELISQVPDKTPKGNKSKHSKEDKPEKKDLSKKRGREAAAELRRLNQEKLDSKKRLLDRKLHARETANEISREKSSVTLRVLKTATVQTDENADKTSVPEQVGDEKDKSVIATSDMATQWDYEKLPNEWVPHVVPQLALPKDDSGQEVSPKTVESKTEKSKRPNLFALSDEMPSSLRGGLTGVPEETSAPKPSLTLVSDYILNRDLRLREFSPGPSKTKPAEDLQSIKQTILRSRASRAVSAKGNSNSEKSGKTATDTSLNKKSSVTMYNHSTRDTRDLPYGDKKIVTRDEQADEDAYSQAMKVNSSEMVTQEKEQGKNMQDLRNRIAVSKQNVEKEFQDTMAFLNSMPKDKSKPIKNAYRDEHQQQIHKDCRQRKMQQEFKKIQRESLKHRGLCRHKGQSILKDISDDDFNEKDFKYSWMPVPESDGNLAVHTIPTTLKEPKSGNGVKFSKIDSYHEYRSRHKHTPPTKDIPDDDRQTLVDALIADQDDDETTTSTSSDLSSEVNLNINKKSHSNRKTEISEAEKIIIYKILDSKSDKKVKELRKSSKLLKNIVRSLNFLDKNHSNVDIGEELRSNQTKLNAVRDTIDDGLRKTSLTNKSLECIQEGLYKKVNEQGDNIASVYFSDSVAKEQEDSNGDVEKRTSKCHEGSNRNISNQKSVNKTNTVAPSVLTSAASFKTAFNDKATTHIDEPPDENVKEKVLTDISEGGCIKIIDEKGQESGKFYIGASGFLSDDAYEVIIQLRKKDGTKAITTNTMKEAGDSVIKSKTDIPVQEAEKVQTGIQDQPEKNIQNDKSTMPTVTQSISERLLFNVDLECKQDNNKQEKGVSTTCQDPFTIINKSSNSKVANSVCTQTLDSPPYRPAYNHMSSSTSTAYLSPPDVIVPPLIQNDRICLHQTTPLRKRERKAKLVSKLGANKDSSALLAKRFSFLKKYVIAQSKLPSVTQIPKIAKLKVPPNTARTNSSICVHGDHKVTKNLTTASVKKFKPCQCSRNIAPKTKPNMAKGKIYSTTAPVSKNSIKPDKSGMNPVVKYYVDQLLDLNKDEKTALQIFNQECSNVSTPGSSIINVPHNVNGGKATLEQLKDMLIKEILEQPENDNVPKLKNLRHPKKKTVHKVKSLKISKDLIPGKANRQEYKCHSSSNTSFVDHVIRSISIQPRKLKKTRSRSSPSPRKNKDSTFKSNSSDALYSQTKKNEEKRPSSANPNINDRIPFTVNCRPSTEVYQSPEPCFQIWKNPETDSEPNSNNQSKSLGPIVCHIQTHEKRTPNTQKQSWQTTKKCLQKNEQKSPKNASFWSLLRAHINTQNVDKKRKTPQDQANQKQGQASSQEQAPQIQKQRTQTNESPTLQNPAQLVEGQINTSLEQLSQVSKQTRETSCNIQDQCYLQHSQALQASSQEPGSCSASQVSPSLEGAPNILNQIPKSQERYQISENPHSSQSNAPYVPLSMSTQTNDEIGEEITFLKLAEDKLQNMEKIADLTEQCTQRLSNLAKVLEEVRKSKIAPSQVSDSASELDIAGASVDTSYTQAISPAYEPVIKIKEKPTANSPPNPEVLEQDSFVEETSPKLKSKKSKSPKSTTSSKLSISPNRTNITRARSPNNANADFHSVKSRGKPPTALSRKSLKHTSEYVAPHELSTVLEVDSPLSIKYKNQSTRKDIESHLSNGSDIEEKLSENANKEDKRNNPDLVPSSTTTVPTNFSLTDSSDEFKMQMMDLKQFNEIMLKPFISIQDYAKQCNLDTLEEGSNLESSNIPKDDVINDDLSSLHSDGSLPDVIAELLKRKIISEPFKFDTINSSTVTSESTVSVLALSKVKRDKKKSKTTFSNKENLGETSDTLSISSNPDLENAFEKLGMGWASSTLKKTKERLALSSSSNTSSSSILPYKQQGYPELVTDSSSIPNASRIKLQKKEVTECTKSTGLQTSLTNAMTVKQFLTNELAKKITFTHKSHSYRDEEEEFISLYETKIPETMKHTTKMPRDERSIDSNARARTSTPVQLYKSMTYRTSSSSNISNGLFSNADDLSSVKGTSNSQKNHSVSEKDDLTIPNFSLRTKKTLSDRSKSD